MASELPCKLAVFFANALERLSNARSGEKTTVLQSTSEQDDSRDFAETEPTETSAISEEQEILLREYIKHHSEMKVFLKRSLRKGQKEGSSALRDYIKNSKPKKPKTSLDKLFEHKPCTQAESEHTVFYQLNAGPRLNAGSKRLFFK